MELKKTTFMKKYMIINVYNNISGMKQDLITEDGYEYIDYILDDLKYAYNHKEDYLMNLLTEEALKELIQISKNYRILTSDYPFGKYPMIGITGNPKWKHD